MRVPLTGETHPGDRRFRSQPVYVAVRWSGLARSSFPPHDEAGDHRQHPDQGGRDHHQWDPPHQQGGGRRRADQQSEHQQRADGLERPDDADGDADGDIFTNRKEYMLNTDPMDPADKPTLESGFDADFDLDGSDLAGFADGLASGVLTEADLEEFAVNFGK